MTAVAHSLQTGHLSDRKDASLMTTSGSSVYVVVQHLEKTFTLHGQGGVALPVLHDVNLCVHAGEAVALTGPSGAGKSTLLRCLSGNYQPTSGTIFVRHDGVLIDFTKASPTEIIHVRHRTIGWVSQFLRVIPRVPTIEIVAEPLIANEVPKADALMRAASMLQDLNVPERLWNLAPATFSGGEQQRVNIARGLIREHSILLLDEPTASLDPHNTEIVVSLLQSRRDLGAAIVGIFHDTNVRDALTTRSLEVSVQVSNKGNPVPANNEHDHNEHCRIEVAGA